MKSILLVEDNQDDTFFMQRAFKQAAIQNPLVVIEDGQSALEFLKNSLNDHKSEELPGLVLLDLNLPLKSGMEILEWIRLQPKLKKLPTVVLTSSELATEGSSAIGRGASATLTKPPTPAKLIALKEQLGLSEVLIQENRSPSSQ
jgi:CheY-like chemotaxis protein